MHLSDGGVDLYTLGQHPLDVYAGSLLQAEGERPMFFDALGLRVHESGALQVGVALRYNVVGPSRFSLMDTRVVSPPGAWTKVVGGAFIEGEYD